MAPKKNGIEVEQELKGESCPGRATPPSKPGATGRQGQKWKNLRRVWWQVKNKKLKKATGLYTPFVRLVKEITESCSSQVNRWTPEAILSLQEAADFYLNETFDMEFLLTIRQMIASSTADDEQGEEHAGGSPEEAEEKPNGLA